jgi:hypothetical protein
MGMINDMQATPAIENRESSRVVMHGDARIQFTIAGETHALPCTVTDISITGCKAIIPREHIPQGWQWRAGIEFELVLRKPHRKNLEFTAGLIWSQRIADGFDAVGLHFQELDEEDFRSLNRQILLRIRAGMEIYGPLRAEDNLDERVELSTPLSVDAWPESEAAYHMEILSAGPHRAVLRGAPKKGEEMRIPQQGDVLNFCIYPPAWAEVRMRTLRFSGMVESVDGATCEISYLAEGHDIQLMILGILPKERRLKRTQKDHTLYYVAAALALLVLWMLSHA